MAITHKMANAYPLCPVLDFNNIFRGDTFKIRYLKTGQGPWPIRTAAPANRNRCQSEAIGIAKSICNDPGDRHIVSSESFIIQHDIICWPLIDLKQYFNSYCATSFYQDRVKGLHNLVSTYFPGFYLSTCLNTKLPDHKPPATVCQWWGTSSREKQGFQDLNVSFLLMGYSVSAKTFPLITWNTIELSGLSRDILSDVFLDYVLPVHLSTSKS